MRPLKEICTNLNEAIHVLEELRDDIENTGGVISVGGYVAPKANPEWTELGSTYLGACKVLGTEPMIVEEDPEGGEPRPGEKPGQQAHMRISGSDKVHRTTLLPEACTWVSRCGLLFGANDQTIVRTHAWPTCKTCRRILDKEVK